MIGNRTWILTGAVTLVLVMAVLLAGCDPGGRLSQLTPQPPAATPMLLGVTVEPPFDIPPTSQPAQIPPTATYDNALPAWTVLYYANGDNQQAEFVWQALNEMEAAGQSSQVQVIAQTDWPNEGPAGTSDLVRYVIQADNDPAQLTSPPASLGEGNMGDPATLADFLQWGITTFPANRYALIMGDFGGGWQGCCLDTAIDIPDESDHLSLPDIDQALAIALGQSGRRLDVIAFNGSLMSQVDVLSVLPPFASYAVASPGLLPASAWNLTAVLGYLYSNPTIDGRQLATDLVSAFVANQSRPAGDTYAAMTAIDLSASPRMTAAVETLALAISNDPLLRSAIAADARRGAQQYGAAIPSETERIAAVDLLHAAAILSEISPPGELRNSALEVVAAVTNAVITFERGPGCCVNGRGVAIYWPASSNYLDPLYAQVSRLPLWVNFLSAFVNNEPNSPLLALTLSPRNPVNLSQPVIMAAELTGRRLDEFAMIATQTTTDGRQVVRHYETISPSPLILPSGTTVSLWNDGRQESNLIWDTTAGYLSDTAGNNEYAVLKTVDVSPVGPQVVVEGVFQPVEGGPGWEAGLTFDTNSAKSKRVWAAATVSSGARLVGEISPTSGDIFQPFLHVIEPNNQWTREAGPTFVFDSTATILRSTRPLPDGEYNVGMAANALGRDIQPASSPQTIDSRPAVPGYRAFIDVAHDIQFLYPLSWPTPSTQDDITLAGNDNTDPAGQILLQIRFYPNWDSDLAALQTEVLSNFGDVSILLHEAYRIGGESGVDGLRTAYGYQSNTRGDRTGVFLTFLYGGVGYLVDIDGPKAQESNTLAIIDTIAANWQFLPPRLGLGAPSWTTITIDGYQLDYPAEFSYQPYSNWHRLAADAQTFLAVRIQPSVRTPAEAMAGLLNVASEGVTSFVADEPFSDYLAGHVWERNDFTYVDTTGTPVTGLLMVRTDGAQEIAVWTETPTEGAMDTINRKFLPAAASIQPISTTPEG